MSLPNRDVLCPRSVSRCRAAVSAAVREVGGRAWNRSRERVAACRVLRGVVRGTGGWVRDCRIESSDCGIGYGVPWVAEMGVDFGMAVGTRVRVWEVRDLVGTLRSLLRVRGL